MYLASERPEHPPSTSIFKPSKNKSRKTAKSTPPKNAHQQTIFTTHFTTHYPPKIHVLQPNFPETPSKNHTKINQTRSTEKWDT
jgi:hypothetical protein